jgi:type 2 lantibiotic biosynthesis protein LanM
VKVIYKPRGVAMEVAFSHLMQWLAREGWPIPLRSPRVLEQPGHGWIEFVNPAACERLSDASNYYERAGALLCLLYLLEGMDVHRENLIASGDNPILIDLETLLHPRPRADVLPVRPEQKDLTRSVLRIGMLPYSESFFDYHLPHDISGLGGTAGFQHASSIADINVCASDSMALRHDANLPFHDGKTLRPEEYEEELIAGFTRMYCFLRDIRGRLTSEHGPLRWLRDQSVRYLFRDTRTYGLLLERLWHPRYLRDGADWAIEMAVLYRSSSQLDMQPDYWPLVGAEIAALQRLDIPLFTASSSANMLSVEGGQQIQGFFEGPSLDLVRRQIELLCEVDMNHQIVLIRLSLARCRLARSEAWGEARGTR